MKCDESREDEIYSIHVNISCLSLFIMVTSRSLFCVTSEDIDHVDNNCFTKYSSIDMIDDKE